MPLLKNLNKKPFTNITFFGNSKKIKIKVLKKNEVKTRLWHKIKVKE